MSAGVVILAALLLVAVAALIRAFFRVTRHWRRAMQALTEAEARENCRPYVDPVTPAYYGLPPHNGTVADQATDDVT